MNDAPPLLVVIECARRETIITSYARKQVIFSANYHSFRRIFIVFGEDSLDCKKGLAKKCLSVYVCLFVCRGQKPVSSDTILEICG